MREEQQTKSPRAQLGAILAISFFGFMGLSMPYLIFPSLFLNPEYSILTPDASEASRGLYLGITLAAYPFGQFLGAPTLGALSDECGRRTIMSMTLFLASIFSLAAAFALEYRLLWLLIGSRFLAGLMEGNLAIARAMAADIKELNKHDTFGKLNAATSISYVLGPFIGGLLSDSSLHENLSLATPFFFISVLFFTLSIVSHLVIAQRPRPIVEPKRSFLERINLKERLRRLFKNRKLKYILLITSSYTLAVDMFYEFGPVYLTKIWLLGPANLAVYNGILALILALGSGFLAAYLAKRYANRSILMVSITATSVALIAMVSTSTSATMIGIFIVIGLAISVTATNLTVQVSDSASDHIQGQVMGALTSLRVLGDACICLLGGVLIALSPKIILVIASFISLLALFYYLKADPIIESQAHVQQS